MSSQSHSLLELKFAKSNNNNSAISCEIMCDTVMLLKSKDVPNVKCERHHIYCTSGFERALEVLRSYGPSFVQSLTIPQSSVRSTTFVPVSFAQRDSFVFVLICDSYRFDVHCSEMDDLYWSSSFSTLDELAHQFTYHFRDECDESSDCFCSHHHE